MKTVTFAFDGPFWLPRSSRSQRRSHFGKVDFSKIEIKTNKIGNNFYTLDGNGGTIGVLSGPDGAFMVDSQFAPLTEKIVAAIKQIQPDGRIRLMVNTHVHGDHTGGNENLGKLAVIIMSRPCCDRRPSGSGANGPRLLRRRPSRCRSSPPRRLVRFT
jgi:glyoxylase-like metal-dependent hydrolase (beta-lactamase superfamily II)